MEASSSLSTHLSITPSPSLLEDDQIRDPLIATNPELDFPEELELSSLIHANPSGSSTLENIKGPSQDTTAALVDDAGQPATAADETAMPNKMNVPAPKGSRPVFPWLFEAGCLFIAIAALVVTVVVLDKFHNQEQPHWPYAHMLNLSALIAVLATLLRSMVTLILEALIGQLKWYWYGRARPVAHLQVFDEASHGAWGSSKLLYRTHEANWQSVSATFMVLSIGIGTFTQLALRTTACSKAVPRAAASIPTAHIFSIPGFESVPFRRVNTTRTESTFKPNAFMNTAVVNGLSGLQSLEAVSASCATGNCSFPSHGDITHSTLGIESMCVDMSPFLIQTVNSTISTGSLLTSSGTNNTLVWNYTKMWTNYTLPQRQASISYLAEGDDPLGMGRWFPLISINTSVISGLDDGFPGLSPQEEYLARRSFHQENFMIPTLNPCLKRSSYPPTADPLPLVNTSSCPQLGVTNVSTFPGYFSLAAVQCYLYPSIRHYAGSIINGQIQEMLTGDPMPLNPGTNSTDGWHSTDDNDLFYYAFLDPCIINGMVYTNMNMSKVPGDRITIRQLNDSEITGPKLCLYGVSIGAIIALERVLDFFAFSQDDWIDWRNGICIPNIDYTDMNCWSRWWLEPLFNGGNASLDSISAVMSRMADALTNQLRMNGTDLYGNPSNVTGTAFQTVVCAQFQWEWLLFPTSMVLASAVLLVATAWKSSPRWGKARSNREGVQVLPVWKSSLLPLLFYGLEDGARLKGSPAEDKEMVDLAGETLARFSFEEDRLRFHSTKPASRE